MNNLDKVKDQLTSLVLGGRRDEAIQLLQEKFGVSEKEAEKLLAVALRESVSPSKFFKGALKGFGDRMSSGKEGFGCRQIIFKLLAVIMGFVGIPMILASIGFYAYDYYQINHSEKINGTIVEVKSYSSTDNSIQYTSNIAYTMSGLEYTAEAPIHSSSPEFEVGESVVLYVNRENPNSVIIDTFIQRWLIITIVGAVGLGFTTMMIVFIVLGRKSNH